MTFRTIKGKDDNHKVETGFCFLTGGKKDIKLLDKFIMKSNSKKERTVKTSKSQSDLEKI